MLQALKDRLSFSYAIQRKLAGESVKVTYIYGFLPSGFSIDFENMFFADPTPAIIYHNGRKIADNLADIGRFRAKNG